MPEQVNQWKLHF